MQKLIISFLLTEHLPRTLLNVRMLINKNKNKNIRKLANIIIKNDFINMSLNKLESIEKLSNSLIYTNCKTSLFTCY